MKILFVCRQNRFRSKVAEAYFRKINKNKKIKSDSAGIFKGYPVAKSVLDLGKKFGLKIKKRRKGLKEKYLDKFDLIVIVANNVPKDIFNKTKKVIDWKIPDTSQDNRERIEAIMKKIFKKIDELNIKLKNEK